MKFKFATSPNKNIDFSIIAMDNQFTTENTSQYLENQYGIVFDPKVDINNSPEIIQIYQNNKKRRIVLIDLSEKYNHQAVLQSFLDLSSTAKNIPGPKIQLDLTLVDIDLVLSPAIQAMELSSYDLALYQTQKNNLHPLGDIKAEITLIMEKAAGKAEKEAVTQAQTIGHYQKEVMNLVNAPYNKLGTKDMVSWIKNQGKKSKIKVSVFNKTKIEKTGLHALLAVNRGSETEPAFIITEYKGNNQKDHTTDNKVSANNELTSTRVRNFKRMERRRVVFKLGVIYQTTAEQLAQISEFVKGIIEKQPDTLFDRGHFATYGDFSLNFEFVYYIIGSDYVKYMDTQQKINLEVYQEFEKRGIEFAYPTQTLFVNKEEKVQN